jgi:hypothetical protein
LRRNISVTFEPRLHGKTILHGEASSGSRGQVGRCGRRGYPHTTRWTSLGLSLLEAMHLGKQAREFALENYGLSG